MFWHNQSIDKTLQILESTSEGITNDEASKRLVRYGPNELKEKEKKPPWHLFLNQFKDFMILILVIASVISGLVGNLTDTFIILVIVLLNAIVGFIQEYRAEKAIEALKKLASLHSLVMRDGIPTRISSSNLVPGDVVLLEAGNAIPADLRLIESGGLRVDESALTGESVPVDKSIQVLTEENLSIGDRINLAFKGTMITAGSGKGLVIATGMNTQLGKIAQLLQVGDTITPLQKRMNEFGKKLSYIILFICAILFGIGMLRGEAPINMLLLSISLAVAAIPEALPALITVSLALGAKRMVKKNALVRKLPAIETLGSVSFICSDKTGTLTVNKMKVTEVYEPVGLQDSSLPLSALLMAMALNHHVKQKKDHSFEGDPTEVSFVEYVTNKIGINGINDLITKHPLISELPFDSDRKCMTTIHRLENRYILFSKGAVEYISGKLLHTEENGHINSLTNEWGNKGLRVLAFAYKVMDQLPEPFSYDTVEKDLVFIGLVGMIDPAREEVKIAIDQCKTAGIKPVMITGDHPSTATAIAKDIGILSQDELVISGERLQEMSDETLNEKVEKISVYARVSPEQKLRIIKSLQLKHHFVAMTGDGVNDAPSLKAANIGVAMGITGTDVSKEAAQLILLDDNFATIVKAVREGRRIYDNIRKFVKYIMTCNGAEIWTIFLAPFIGLPMPLLPIHILWINLVTDGLPGIALASEKAEKDIMKRPPRRPSESLFANGIGYHIIWVGLLMAGITLGVQAWAINENLAHWQTMVFTVLSISQLGHVLAIRSETEFLYQKGIFSNLPLLGAVLLICFLQLGVIYLPFANVIFNTQPLSIYELLICVGASAILFHAVELEKWIKKKYLNNSTSY